MIRCFMAVKGILGTIPALIPRRCDLCKQWRFGVLKRHIGTAYAEDKHNYRTACKPCHEYMSESVEDWWSTYNSGRL